ncbi:amidohydrolase [Sphingomonas sp. MG17]|uniref:Amidohydrolase n=2 Tax=Sphingomonas tagetis TaxID=2949092 RepID=A0A9X2KJU9_9SPHN|nr:amidohydrolase [Sphingomonas tagetis]
MRMTALILAVALAGCAGREPLAPMRYIDAHSHILPDMPAAAEVAMLREAGLAQVVIMSPDPAGLREITAAGRGFVVPFISIARLPDMAGYRLGADSAARFAELHAAGAVCGFGELPTRIEPATDPSDAAALLHPHRMAIYREADRLGLPVNMHIGLDAPETIAAVERIASGHPRMTLVLAHTGWSAGAATIGRLMDAHANIHADLSVRLDPAAGWPSPGGGAAVPAKITILDADGVVRPDWRALILRHPNRFMFGMDITSAGGGRAGQAKLLLATARNALGQLPRKVEAAVAHGNAERMIAGCAAKGVFGNP